MVRYFILNSRHVLVCVTMAKTLTKNATKEMERVVKKELTESEASSLLTTFSSQAVLISLGQFKATLST